MQTQRNTSERRNIFQERLISFTIDILHLAEGLRAISMLRSIVDQLIRSASSIGANVTEAKAGSSRKDYAHFMQIALKSANETIYWLSVLERYDVSLRPKTALLLKEANELANILGASVLTLRGKKTI